MNLHDVLNALLRAFVIALFVSAFFPRRWTFRAALACSFIGALMTMIWGYV